MNRAFIAKAAFLAVASMAIASAAVASAQHPPAPIQVLEMPVDATPGAFKNWNSNLSFNYNGRMNQDRAIWARVFRGAKKDLIANIPRLTPKNKCAVYAQLEVLSVDHGIDGQLRIGDLEHFFKMQRNQIQTFTIVFEEGVDPSHSEALYLKKSEVAHYFNNGVEITLTSDPALDALWHSEAEAEQAANHPPPRSWYQRALAVVGVDSPVQAAPTVTPPPQVEAVAEPPKIEPQCQSVQAVPLRAQLDNPSSPTRTTEEALVPVLLRQPTPCGQ